MTESNIKLDDAIASLKSLILPGIIRTISGTRQQLDELISMDVKDNDPAKANIEYFLSSALMDLRSAANILADMTYEISVLRSKILKD